MINSVELNGTIQIKVKEVEKIILDAQLNGIELSVAFIKKLVKQYQNEH